MDFHLEFFVCLRIAPLKSYKIDWEKICMCFNNNNNDNKAREKKTNRNYQHTASACNVHFCQYLETVRRCQSDFAKVLETLLRWCWLNIVLLLKWQIRISWQFSSCWQRVSEREREAVEMALETILTKVKQKHTHLRCIFTTKRSPDSDVNFVGFLFCSRYFSFHSTRIYISQFTLYRSSVQVEDSLRVFFPLSSICFANVEYSVGGREKRREGGREGQTNVCKYVHKYVCFETTL